MSNKYPTFLNQTRLTKKDYYEYKKQNKKYTDELYPPNDNSIFSLTSTGEFRNKKSGQKLKDELCSMLEKDSKKLTIEWERISDTAYFTQIYNDKISHEQIEQGSLGDCYLISLIASISHFPKLLTGDGRVAGAEDDLSPHILYNYEFGDIGYYELMFFIDGQFQIVIIDDYLPFVKEKGISMFAGSSENYYWVNLVEKAYSKICGGYTGMDLMDMSESKNRDRYDHFQVMTGYKYKKYPLYEEKENKLILNKEQKTKVLKVIEDNLKDIKNNKKFNTIITTGTPNENKGLYLEENYIPYQHSFSLLDYKKIKINNNSNEIELLLLNNPWGRNIYNEGIGPYCLENLNKDTINLKPYIEYNLKAEDGCFWIDYESFIKNFISVNVCKIPCNYYCVNYFFDDEKFYELPLIYTMKIEKKTNIWFNINMSRSDDIRNFNDTKLLLKIIVINKIDQKGNIVKTYKDISAIEDIQNNYDLDEGNYIIWIYLPKKYFPESKKLKAHFMVSSEYKIKLNFLNYDIDYKYIINAAIFLFNLNEENQKKMKDNKERMINCIVDCNSLDGILVLYLSNNTTNKKIICEPETECSGFSPINEKDGINLKKINTTLYPGQTTYFIGISTSKKASFGIENVNIKYEECDEKRPNQIIINFNEYLKKDINSNIKINSVKYKTNSYSYIMTNFNKNKDKRDEDEAFNYFVGLMTEKMKAKKLPKEKIELISKNMWNKMKKEEKEKIVERYEKKKKELKNNVLKMQVLKYIKRNSLANNDKNMKNMDLEIKNMKIKTRLSQQLQFAKFENELDDLESNIKSILPNIEYLKNTEKDEVELNNYIIKQKSLLEDLKKLLNEKITRENGIEISKKSEEIKKKYELLWKEMEKYLKNHEEKMKLYVEIGQKGMKMKEEITEHLKLHNEKKLNLNKEMNNLMERFINLSDEAGKLKLIEINKKCNTEVLQNHKDIINDINTIKGRLMSLVNEINIENDKIKNKQNEILSQEKYDLITKKQNEILEKIANLKNNYDKYYNPLLPLLKKENDMIEKCEKLKNEMKKETLNDSLDKLKEYENQSQKIADELNKLNNNIKNYGETFNKISKEENESKKEILNIFNKFKDDKIPMTILLQNLADKSKDVFNELKSIKIKEISDKRKELFDTWDKVNKGFKSSYEKMRSFIGDKGKLNIEINNNKSNNNISNEKKKEIKDKISKEMIKLENDQKEIKNKLDKIKNDKIKLINDMNAFGDEEEKLIASITHLFNNDIKKITFSNFKENLEKYKVFNEKYKEKVTRINNISASCKSLFETFNSFIKEEYENRSKIYNNVEELENNNINIEDKFLGILKVTKTITDELRSINIQELNDIFKNNVNSKFDKINAIQKALVNASKQK